MPLPSLIPAIVSSIIQSVVEAPDAPPARPAGPVVALARALPAEAQLGVMSPPSAGMVQIGDRILPLSPAAQIRNEMNMIVTPYSLQQPATVRYLTDFTGAVWRVWILTPAELAASR